MNTVTTTSCFYGEKESIYLDTLLTGALFKRCHLLLPHISAGMEVGVGVGLSESNRIAGSIISV